MPGEDRLNTGPLWPSCRPTTRRSVCQGHENNQQPWNTFHHLSSASWLLRGTDQDECPHTSTDLSCDSKGLWDSAGWGARPARPACSTLTPNNPLHPLPSLPPPIPPQTPHPDLAVPRASVLASWRLSYYHNYPGGIAGSSHMAEAVHV